MPANELRLNDFRDLKETLVMQHAVNILLALLAGLLVGPKLSGLLVFGLQFI